MRFRPTPDVHLQPYSPMADAFLDTEFVSRVDVASIPLAATSNSPTLESITAANCFHLSIFDP